MKKILFLVLLCSFSPAHARQKGTLYAVIVGVSEYRHISNLVYSHRDALEMYELLKLQTAPANLKLLTNRQATKDSILSAMNSLFTQTKPEDIVIFYFSGHGTTGYFFAHDREIEFTSLQAIFKKTGAKRKLVFADACHSGTLRTTSSGQPAATQTHAGVGDHVLLFLSSRSDQTSKESTALKNGAFTYFLIAGLKGGADANNDRVIAARELFDFVHPKVNEATKGTQNPVMWGKFDDTMVILNWEK